MLRLETRIATLEKAAGHFDLKAMTDDELRAHAKTCVPGSNAMYAAVLTLVGRRGSAFLPVAEHPDNVISRERA